MKAISYYYGSRVNPIPKDVEKWLENLPAINKLKIAKALINQIDDSFTAPSQPNSTTIIRGELIMAEFLINERSKALLNLVDAFKLSESELQDVWDGVFNRISQLHEAAKATWKPVGFDDPMMHYCEECMGSGYIDGFEDDVEYECPSCAGTGTIRDDEGLEELVDDDDLIDDQSIVGAIMRGRRSLQDGPDPFEDEPEETPFDDDRESCHECGGCGHHDENRNVPCMNCTGSGLQPL